nr:transposase [Mariprofundus ferrooxydans]
MLRGNGGQDIFFAPDDRYQLYFLIQEGIERFGHRVHAFCLMNNHIHLAVQVSDIPLSRVMQNLAFRYTLWINRRYQRIGHLFQGRYKALLVDGDSYLLELVRYIHLNPVRSELVSRPEDYEWSGHRAYIGDDNIPWLTCDSVLAQFGSTIHVARGRYVSFVMDGVSGTHRPEFHQGDDDSRILGEDLFVSRVMTQTEEPAPIRISLDELLISVAQAFGIEDTDLSGPSRKRSFAEARGVAAWLASELGLHPLADLARRLNRDPSALSLLTKKTRERMKNDPEFELKVTRVKLNLSSNNSITHA